VKDKPHDFGSNEITTVKWWYPSPIKVINIDNFIPLYFELMLKNDVKYTFFGKNLLLMWKAETHSRC